jgi:hypothetical protein
VPYPIVDVSDWPPAGEEQLGTKPKQWLSDPDTGERWLWKESTWNRTPDGVRYRKGDDWSERVACEVARGLDLPTAEVELATRGTVVGVISRRFLADGDGLVHGNELIVLDDPRGRAGYTPSKVEWALGGSSPPEDHPVLANAMDWFTGYLVLDALIGNTDRHIENWGIVATPGQRPRLAPTFDHASCLGFLLSDEARTECLTTRDRNRTIEAYARGARTKFEGRRHPVEVAHDALRRRTAATQVHWSAAVASLPSIADEIEAVPPSRMSPAAREFASHLYKENHTSLSQTFRSLCP